MTVRLVTYNLLSTALCTPEAYPHCEPDALAPEARVPAVLARIGAWCDQRAILCLQEVSRDWADALLPVLASRGYQHASAHYGHPDNGYMGVLTAWPACAESGSEFKLLAVSSQRLTDTLSAEVAPEQVAQLEEVVMANWGACSFPAPPRARFTQPTWADLASRVWRATQECALWLPRRLGFGPALPPPDTPMRLAMARKNCLLWVRLQHADSGTQFCVANYHMPCMFWNTPVMCLHAAMAAMVTRALSGPAPYVLAGDFNLKPWDSGYQVLARGLPHAPFKQSITVQPNEFLVRRHVSAMDAFHKEEPPFTCWTQAAEGPFFKATLDYIWLSVGDDLECQWRCDEAHVSACNKGPLPSREQPSDHLSLEVLLRWRYH